jgi:hypothetical protein
MNTLATAAAQAEAAQAGPRSSASWRKPIVVWLAVLIGAVVPWPVGPVPPAHAAPGTTLGFTSLPSAQEWTYGSGDNTAESAFFSADGTQLHMTTMGSGYYGHGYILHTPIDPQRPFTLSMRARVTAYEDQSGANPYGFMFSATIGNEQFDIGVSPIGIRGGAGDHYFTTAVDVTQFHDYLIVGPQAVAGVGPGDGAGVRGSGRAAGELCAAWADGDRCAVGASWRRSHPGFR